MFSKFTKKMVCTENKKKNFRNSERNCFLTTNNSH